MKHGFARTMGLLMAIALLFACLPAYADNGLFYYELKGNGTARITGFAWGKYREDQDIFIPQMIDGYTVTEIGSFAFARSVESFEKPGSGVYYHYIDYSDAERARLVIPETVQKIGEKAFLNSGIGYVSIPASVTTIGTAAFCTGKLKNVTVHTDNANYASIDGSLYSKKDKELLALAIETTSVPDGILSIGEYACINHWLQPEWYKVKFPNSIEVIKSYAFYNIDNSAITYQNKDKNTIKIRFDRVKSIGDYAFAMLKGNIDLYFGGALSEIGTGAFIYTCLHGLHLEQCTKVAKIQEHTFTGYRKWGRHDVKEVFLPNNVEEIGKGAFSGADTYAFSFGSMKPISIDNYAFGDTTGGIDVGDRFFSRVESIGNFAFKGGCFKIGFKDVIDIPSSCTFIGKNAFNEKDTMFKVQPGSYAEEWAQENGYEYDNGIKADTSWLN